MTAPKLRIVGRDEIPPTPDGNDGKIIHPITGSQLLEIGEAAQISEHLRKVLGIPFSNISIPGDEEEMN